MITHRKMRRKTKPCLLCAEHTYDWDRICVPCRNVWEEGCLRDTQQRLLNGDREFYSIRWYVNLRGHDEPVFEFGESEGTMLVKLVQRIAQAVMPDRFRSMPSCRQLGRRGRESGDGFHYLGLTEDQANAVEELIDLCRRLHRTAYEDGVKDGSRLLHRIASGDLPLDQIAEKDKRLARSMQD